MNINRGFTARTRKAFLSGLAILAITACQDASTAPSKLAAPQQPVFLKYQSGSTHFTYQPSQGVLASFGKFVIYMPKGAVCDPSTSSYGPGTWDEPCSPAHKPIAITATTFVNGQGLPYVQFEPALRFAPDASPVLLFVYDKHVAQSQSSNIVYCTDAGECTDESTSDLALKLQFATDAGYVYRQLKHFSGYNVTAGFSDTSVPGSSFTY